MIRCARCWATGQQVSVWRWFSKGKPAIADEVVCCLANMRREM